MLREDIDRAKVVTAHWEDYFRKNPSKGNTGVMAVICMLVIYIRHLERKTIVLDAILEERGSEVTLWGWFKNFWV